MSAEVVAPIQTHRLPRQTGNEEVDEGINEEHEDQHRDGKAQSAARNLDPRPPPANGKNRAAEHNEHREHQNKLGNAEGFTTYRKERADVDRRGGEERDRPNGREGP